MKPSKYNVDYNSNENGTDTYFYIKNNKPYVQFSWQTSRPKPNFVAYTKLLTPSFWKYYPIENCYDWFYDYHIHDIRLGSVKYYHLPNQIRQLLKIDVIRFTKYTKYPYDMYLNIIQNRNYRVMNLLNSICGFVSTLNPNKRIIRYDLYGLNSVIDIIHRKDDERLLFKHDSRNANPFDFNTHSEDVIMELVGLGFNIVSIMRKICRARAKDKEYATN